jgi:phosphate starvation-inducible protein PhoH and related proteins
MGRRSSHGALAVRMVENGHTGMTKPWSPLAGLDVDREQGYLRKVRPRSDGQRRLMEAIERYHLTIALGPAGTGKTYLAVSAAVAALEAGEVGRIVLTRPAVEAGERLGYLPGDIGEKLAPYLRPLNDALNERLGGRRVKQLMTEGAIEIASLADCRQWCGHSPDSRR